MKDKISAKYVELVTVTIRQPYYADGYCKTYTVEPQADFELIPTDECLETMRRLDLVFRNNECNAGFVMLARVSGKNLSGDNILRFPPKIDDKLSFWVKLRNPDVLNFDDLPPSNSDGIYYFTNQRNDGLAPRSNLHLSSTASGVSGSSDKIPKVGTTYRFHHTAKVAAGTATVKHLLSGTDVIPASITNQGGQSDLLFNLLGLPLGKCRLIIDGNTEDEFYYSGSAPTRPFGVIELSLSQTLPTNYRIVEADRSLTSIRPAYSLLFPCRKTYWRYTVHLQPNSPLYVEMADLNAPDKADFLNRLNIVSNDGTVAFTRTSATDTDIIFVSDSELALQEKYISSTSMTHDPLRLTLKKYIGVMAKEAVVRSDLPYPQTGLIDATSLPVIYSDIFLTL